jgi:uncharacterized membrane protein YGL010W
MKTLTIGNADFLMAEDSNGTNKLYHSVVVPVSAFALVVLLASNSCTGLRHDVARSVFVVVIVVVS